MPRSHAQHAKTLRRRHPLAAAITLVMVASLFATAFSFAVPTVRAQAATNALATASVTPDTALVYLDVNLDTTSDQWSRANELLARIGVSDAVDSALNNSNMSASEKEIAQAVLGGEVAVVLEKFPATGDLGTSSLTSDITDPAKLASGVAPQGYALILAPSDLDKSYSAIRQGLAKQADANGTTVEKTTYKGVEIESVAPAATSGSATSATPSLSGMATAAEASSGQAVAQVKDFIIFGSVPEDLHGIIDTANGDTPALADDGHFKDLRGELNQAFLAFGFVNGPATLASMQAADPQAVSQLGTQSEQLFQSFSAFVVWADDPGLRIDTLGVSATGTPLPQMKPIDDTMAQKVSADSLVFTTSTELGQNPGLQALALALAQGMLGTGTMKGATPAAAVNPDQVFEQAAGVLGFNLKTDFLDQLTGNYALALTVENVFSGVPTINGIIVSDTKDEATINKTVTQIISLLKSGVGDSATVSTRTVGGSKVTEFDLSSGGFPLKAQLGVVNGQFVIGVGDGLDEYVNGPAKPLADDANYKQVMSALPKDHTSVAYLNVQLLLPLIEGYMTTMSSSGMGSAMGATPAAGAQQGMTLDQFKPLKGIGAVAFNKDEMIGSSMIVYIASK